MSVIKLSKKNYFHNLDMINNIVGDKSKIMVVLKDNAYGHGLEEISSMAYEYGIKIAIVRDRDEALRVKKYFDKILIFNSKDSQLDDFVYTLNDINDIEKLKRNKIAIKISSNMNRNGIKIEHLESILKQNSNIDSIFMHHGDAGDNNTKFDTQVKEWTKIKEHAKQILKKHNIDNVYFHSSNSHATFRNYIEGESTRCGIATYGYENSSLKPVLSLWADQVTQTDIKAGQTVGYSSTFQANQDMSISTYDIGYSDGIMRFDGSLTLHTATQERFIGTCSMDYVSINSTKKRVCIFDNADYLAKKFNTISYDVLVKLSSKIKRVIL